MLFLILHPILLILLFINLFLIQPWYTEYKNLLFEHISELIIYRKYWIVAFTLNLIVFSFSIFLLIDEFSPSRIIFYLITEFSLFLIINLYFLLKLPRSLFEYKKHSEYLEKQQKSTVVFINELAKKLEKEKEKNRLLEIKFKRNREDSEQIERIKKDYLKLKDKYDYLNNYVKGETKKSK